MGIQALEARRREMAEKQIQSNGNLIAQVFSMKLQSELRAKDKANLSAEEDQMLGLQSARSQSGRDAF